jgi:hypothetical protein
MDAGPPCNSVVNGAPFVTPTDDPDGGAAPPPATGGAVVSGTYALTSSTYYPSSACTSFEPTATTLVVSASSDTAGTFELAFGTATSAFTQTASYSTAGTMLTLVLNCIMPPTISVGTTSTAPYDATASTLSVYVPNGGCGSHVDLYTKQ